MGATADNLLEHGDVLLRYALSRTGDRATAEDLVQDTLVTAITKIADFEGRSSLRTWLVGILRHKILDHFRWRERHPADQEDSWFTDLGVWRSDPNAGLDVLDPEQGAEQSELRAILQLCIDHLPKSLHRVFVLRELEELEPAQVCDTAGISRDSLSVFIYRARQSLRACIQKQWGES